MNKANMKLLFLTLCSYSFGDAPLFAGVVMWTGHVGMIATCVAIPSSQKLRTEQVQSGPSWVQAHVFGWLCILTYSLRCSAYPQQPYVDTFYRHADADQN